MFQLILKVLGVVMWESQILKACVKDVTVFLHLQQNFVYIWFIKFKTNLTQNTSYNSVILTHQPLEYTQTII